MKNTQPDGSIVTNTFRGTNSMIKATKLVLDGQIHQLLQLRNPWKDTNWYGKWSDSSDIWTPELKKQLNFTEEDDGTFWMEFEDAKHIFEFIEICKVNDNYLYNYLECPDSTQRFFRVTIDKPGKYTFSVTQKDAPFDKDQPCYFYNDCQIGLYKMGQGNLEFVKGEGAFAKNVWIECELEEGQYTLNTLVKADQT